MVGRDMKGKPLAEVGEIDERPERTETVDIPVSLVSPNPKEFLIAFEKEATDNLGADIYHGDPDRIKILKVNDGLLAKWNKANPTKAVKAGDYIMNINGAKGDSKAMLEALPSARKTEMTIFSPASEQFMINLDKAIGGDILGVDVDLSNNDSLIVESVHEDGLMGKWNEANPTKAVQAGDLIVDVNGTQGDNQDMMKAIKNGTKLNMQISRRSAT